jgi:hypothetical protein
MGSKRVKALEPMKAMRAFCIDCMGTKANLGYNKLVRECNSDDCPLWPYRFGMGIRMIARCGLIALGWVQREQRRKGRRWEFEGR